MGNKNYLNNEVHLNIYSISDSAYSVFLYYFGHTATYYSVNIYDFKWTWYHIHRLWIIMEKCRGNKLIGNRLMFAHLGKRNVLCLQPPRMEERTTMILCTFPHQRGEQDYSDFTQRQPREPFLLSMETYHNLHVIAEGISFHSNFLYVLILRMLLTHILNFNEFDSPWFTFF